MLEFFFYVIDDHEFIVSTKMYAYYVRDIYDVLKVLLTYLY